MAIDRCGKLTPKVAVSQFLHMTCGDDTPTKVYAAKTQVSNRAVPTNFSDETDELLAGFLAGPRGLLHRAPTDDYHRTPLGLSRSRHTDAQDSTRGGVSLFFLSRLTVDTVLTLDVRGRRYYTHRSVLPPSHATFLDLNATSLTPSHVTRPIHNAFALPHLAESLEVEILEPHYLRSAAAELMGRSVLGKSDDDDVGVATRSRLRADVAFSEEELAQRREKVVQLNEVVEVGTSPLRFAAVPFTDEGALTRTTDMRHVPSLVSFLSLLRSERFSTPRAPTIKLINFDQPPPKEQHWQRWHLPAVLDSVQPCRQLEKLPGCDAICRGSREGAFTFSGGWPTLDFE